MHVQINYEHSLRKNDIKQVKRKINILYNRILQKFLHTVIIETKVVENFSKEPLTTVGKLNSICRSYQPTPRGAKIISSRTLEHVCLIIRKNCDQCTMSFHQ